MCLFSFTIQLELTIDHLPPINEPLVCAFTTLDKPTIYTNATRKRNGVNCTTPRTDLLPQIAQGKRKFQHFSTRSLFLSLSFAVLLVHKRCIYIYFISSIFQFCRYLVWVFLSRILLLLFVVGCRRPSSMLQNPAIVTVLRCTFAHNFHFVKNCMRNKKEWNGN